MVKHCVLCVADEKSLSDPKPCLLCTLLSYTEMSNCFLTEALGNGRESRLSGGREGWDIPSALENGTWRNCALTLGLEVGLTSRGRNPKCKKHLQGKAEGSGSCSAHFSPRQAPGHEALALSELGILIKEESQCWEVSRVTLQPCKNQSMGKWSQDTWRKSRVPVQCGSHLVPHHSYPPSGNVSLIRFPARLPSANVTGGANSG